MREETKARGGDMSHRKLLLSQDRKTCTQHEGPKPSLPPLPVRALPWVRAQGPLASITHFW